LSYLVARQPLQLLRYRITFQRHSTTPQTWASQLVSHQTLATRKPTDKATGDFGLIGLAVCIAMRALYSSNSADYSAGHGSELDPQRVSNYSTIGIFHKQG
jgi:hypothetical protein